jgi:transmembrane sensor
MPHAHYLLDDFLLDESFQAYAAGTDAQAVQYWAQWLAAHPEKQLEAQQAHALLQDLAHARSQPVPISLKEHELVRFQQARRVLPVPAPRLRTQRRLRWALGALASLLLLAGLRWWQWPSTPSGGTTRYATGQGYQRTLTLPDGSMVTLNGNSTLTTAATWQPNSPREVWLTGEGYFQVKHLANKPIANIAGAPANVKFVVYAGKLNIAVLGTEFDVNSRPGATRVVLTEGRVAVERQALLARESLLMQPGDLVESTTAEPGLNRRHVRPTLYSAWTKGHLDFRQTTVRDIVQLLQDNYGLRVTVTAPALLRLTVTGDLPASDIDLLLPALAKSLEIKVTRTGDTVRLSPADR